MENYISENKSDTELHNHISDSGADLYNGIDITPKISDDIDILQKLLAGRYRVIKKLGKGSQGAVFLAESCMNNEKVAIKQLEIQSVKDWKKYDLFQREASVLKQLNISGVAKLYETIESLDETAPMALIVQEYIEGAPLQQFISNGHRFQIGQIGDIMLQLLDILYKLHHCEPLVIHRDIKPSNILLNYREDNSVPEVHLIDFGAVSNPQVKGGGSTVVGTYGYMAPEQLMGRACAESDIYSLAVVAVYLLSGVAPENLEVQDYHVLIDSPLEHLPYAITAFLRKMLEPRIEDRMTDYEQIRSFFVALKEQRFDDIPKVSDSIINTKYSLDEVYSYRQTGNIVLWQELKDSTPRPLPMYFRRMYCKSLFNKQNLFFVLMVLAASTVSIINLIIILGDDAINGLSVIVAIMLLTFLMILPCLIEAIIYSRRTYSPYYFIKNARKSMATVIRIEYLSPYESIKRDVVRLQKLHESSWRITYSFNPPDDASSENLIRSIETHVKPDVKEGDLIPILYLIDHGKLNFNKYIPFLGDVCDDKYGDHRQDEQANEQENDTEIVYSMPYPVPVSDEYIPSKGERER